MYNHFIKSYDLCIGNDWLDEYNRFQMALVNRYTWEDMIDGYENDQEFIDELSRDFGPDFKYGYFKHGSICKEDWIVQPDAIKSLDKLYSKGAFKDGELYIYIDW